ncbi:flavin reductase family protein, partial [Rhizobiaceae sp. 2RAB30]
FMKSIVEELIADGVAADRIRWEAFAGQKPVIGISDETTAPVEDAQGATVHFSRSGKTVEWDRRYGSLLDLAESIGISARSSCRAGTCFSCSTKVVSGEVHYGEELEDAPDEGTALICCARPAGPVTLEL